MIFTNRIDAGKRLANALSSYKTQDVVVYALPRGGVVPGAEVARALAAPLDLMIVRKIGHPYSPEYAIAAIAEDGHKVINRDELNTIDQEWFQGAARAEQEEARRRRKVYMRGRSSIPATGKTAILVDDGLATGMTMFLAIEEVRHFRPRKIVVAVPVAPPEAIEELNNVADEVIALHISRDFGAIGSFYLNFDQVSDDEVITLMDSAPRPESEPRRTVPHGVK